VGGNALAAGLTAILALATVGVPIAPADPASPFAITNVDSPDPVASGAELTYTITVVNTGGAKVNDVVLSDQVNGVGGIGVPPQLVLTSSRGSCAQDANLVTCSGGTIEGGGSWVVTIRGIVTAASGTTLNNTASVTGTKSAQNFTSTATANTLVSNGGGSPLADLAISKAGPTSVVVLSPMTYTLTVNNTGNANATDVKVVDTVPAGLTLISASGTSLFVCGVAVQTVTCAGGAVNQGSNATITINATSPAIPTTITNTASVDPENTISESNELNNTSALVNTQVTAGAPSPTLTINKTDNPAEIPGAGPDPVNPGGLLTYKIFVTNTASTRADDVVVVDGTQGLEAASINVNQVITDGTVGNNGGCIVNAPQVRCTARTLDAGGTILVTISGQVVASAGSTLFNTATVTGNIKNQGVTNTDSELTTVKPGVDLTVTKADSPDPVCARSWPGPGGVCQGGLTYTFVVGNSGIQEATNVVLRDPLAPGLIFDSYQNVALFDAGFVCAVDGANVVTCTGGTIPPESIKKVTFLLVAPASTGTITNVVTVDPFNAIFEADETNNSFIQTTQVVTGIDLVIKKDDSPPGSPEGFDPIATSGTETYTITVDNIGTQDATGIRVRDTLPAESIFRTASGDHGFTCSHSAGVVDCVGGSLKGTASEFYPAPGPGDDKAIIKIRIFAQPIVGVMHNEVRVDPLNEIAEADEGNNFAFQDTVVNSGTAGAFNELTILKTQTSPLNPVARNALVIYNIAIGNDGSDPAVDVAVRDFLPAGARYIEATGTDGFHCTESGNVVNCVGGTVPAGGTVNLTVKSFAPDTPGTYINQAIVDPDFNIPEGNEFNNESSVPTVVENGGNGPFNDLSISKSAPLIVKPNETFTYTLVVTNSPTSTNAALDVSVRDVLPSQVTFVSAADAAPLSPGAFTCTQGAGIVNCTGGTLPAAGGTRNILIKVKAPNLTDVTLTNQVFVDPENLIPEGDETNNTFTFHNAVNSNINLSIDKTGPHTSSQNQVTSYKLTIVNQSPSSQGLGSDTGQTAFNVEVHDPLPVGLIPLAVDTGSGNNFACQISENPINVVDCVGDLNPDSPVTIEIFIFMTAETNRSLDNEACVDPKDLIKEFSKPDGSLGETDNCSTHSVVVGPPAKRSPNFLVSKSVDQSVASPGDTLSYTITVTNNGDAKAKGVITVTDNLPDQTEAVDISGPNLWTCSVPGDVMTCTNPGAPDDELAVGASVQFTVHATVKPTASLPLVNVATASAALADPAETDAEDETTANQADNTATANTGVGSAGFDLSIGSITDNPDPANPGKQVAYTIVGLNGGSQAANGVHIDITLPSNSAATFVAADGSNGFNCAAPVGTLVVCIGDLPAGGNTVITVKLTVVLAPPGDLVLSATIDPANAFTEVNEGNNTQTETTTVSGSVCTGCVDLVSALLTATPDPVTSGGSITFKYVLVNAGDQPTTFAAGQQIAFFDFFGTHTGFAISSSDAAVTCTSISSTLTSVLNDCVGNLGGGQGVTITATISGVSGADITAFATADPLGFIAEFSETNNALSESVVIN
jgi:uncharacterized repeat protein (TIGR01451 family)